MIKTRGQKLTYVSLVETFCGLHDDKVKSDTATGSQVQEALVNL